MTTTQPPASPKPEAPSQSQGSSRSPSRKKGSRIRKRTALPTAEVRSRLLDAALAQIRTQGYDETSVAELTRKIGVAKGTFFNHFATKEALLFEWFSACWLEVERRIESESAGGAGAIIRFAEALGEAFTAEPALSRAFAIRLHQLPDSGIAAEYPIPRTRRWVEAQLQACLPMIVPIRAISESALATLVTAALFDELLERAIQGAPLERRGQRAPGLLDRLSFLLESAGYSVP